MLLEIGDEKVLLKLGKSLFFKQFEEEMGLIVGDYCSAPENQQSVHSQSSSMKMHQTKPSLNLANGTEAASLTFHCLKAERTVFILHCTFEPFKPLPSLCLVQEHIIKYFTSKSKHINLYGILYFSLNYC